MPLDARPGRLVADWTIDISEDNQVAQEIIDTVGCNQYGIEMPSGWDAATMTFQAENDPDGTFILVQGLAVAVGTSRLVTLTEAEMRALRPYRYLKLRSSAAQLADRAGKFHMSKE